MKKKYNKKAKIPKYLWGALIGTATSVGMGLLNNASAKKRQKKMAQQQAINEQSLEYMDDKNSLESYNKNLNNGVSYYMKKGGKLAKIPYKTKGGDLIPLSSDTVVAKGNKHEESTIDNTSGIKLIENKKPIAEIEDGETIKDGKKVYSDKLIADGSNTFAEKSEELAKEKAKAENNNDTNTVNTIDKLEDNLFQKQEQMKKGKQNKKAKIPKMSFGSWIKKNGKNIVPFIDNVSNAILTANTPKVPKPRLTKFRSNKTDLNYTPQKNQVKESVATANANISNNTSNSSVARANISKNKLRGASVMANVLAQEENAETQLFNQNQQRKQNTEERNNAKIDNYNMQELGRKSAINQRIASNVSNAVGDYVDIKNRESKEKYQNEYLDVLRSGVDSGISRRNMLSSTTDIALMKENPESFRDKFEGTPEYDKWLELMGLRKKAKPLNISPIKANILTNP